MMTFWNVLGLCCNYVIYVNLLLHRSVSSHCEWLDVKESILLITVFLHVLIDGSDTSQPM